MKNIDTYKNRFYSLMEAKSGDVKPLLKEQNGYSWTNSGTQTSSTTTKAEPLSTVSTYSSGGNVDITSRNWCLKYKIPNDQCIKKFCQSNPNKCKESAEEQLFDSIMTVAPVLVSFVPIVGPVLGVALGMGESLYLANQGKKEEAGVVAMFSMIPYVGKLVSKIPGVKQLGAKGMIELGKKIANKTPLSTTEKAVANAVQQQKNVITQELNNHVKSVASTQLSKTTDPKKVNLLKKVITGGIEVSAEEAAVSAVSKG